MSRWLRDLGLVPFASLLAAVVVVPLALMGSCSTPPRPPGAVRDDTGVTVVDSDGKAMRMLVAARPAAGDCAIAYMNGLQCGRADVPGRSDCVYVCPLNLKGSGTP